jgi:CubicO group peptidase (beta-lactamase class C family)
MYHPGDQWQYDLGSQILGVLIARAAAQPLEVFMEERLFGPLGMADTAFYVPESKIHRFATNYYPSDEGLKVYDEATGGEWSKPPLLPQSAGGLVSTADDLLAFARMMSNGGSLGEIQILKPETIAQMTSNQVTPAQTAGQEIFLGDAGWGFGMAVRPQGSIPAGYGWDGGLGTSWYNDPEKNLTGILLTQVSWTSPIPPPIREAFWHHAHQTTP